MEHRVSIGAASHMAEEPQTKKKVIWRRPLGTPYLALKEREGWKLEDPRDLLTGVIKR